MKSSWFFSVFALLFTLNSCINGEQTYRADHTHLLSSGNSKVWMLRGTQQHEDGAISKNTWGEVLFIFYLTGEVLVGSFGDLEKQTFDKGRFEYQEDKEELRIFIANEKWVFKLETRAEDHLVLKTKKGANIAPYLHLVPLTLPD
ncbi:MAG: hypothetical protein ACKOWX_09350 [Flavobacteriales bacterium]